jgi:hypothetical protein
MNLVEEEGELEFGKLSPPPFKRVDAAGTKILTKKNFGGSAWRRREQRESLTSHYNAASRHLVLRFRLWGVFVLFGLFSFFLTSFSLLSQLVIAHDTFKSYK